MPPTTQQNTPPAGQSQSNAAIGREPLQGLTNEKLPEIDRRNFLQQMLAGALAITATTMASAQSSVVSAAPAPYRFPRQPAANGDSITVNQGGSTTITNVHFLDQEGLPFMARPPKGLVPGKLLETTAGSVVDRLAGAGYQGVSIAAGGAVSSYDLRNPSGRAQLVSTLTNQKVQIVFGAPGQPGILVLPFVLTPQAPDGDAPVRMTTPTVTVKGNATEITGITFRERDGTPYLKSENGRASLFRSTAKEVVGALLDAGYSKISIVSSGAGAEFDLTSSLGAQAFENVLCGKNKNRREDSMMKEQGEKPGTFTFGGVIKKVQ